MPNPLSIISSDNEPSKNKPLGSKSSRKEETQAKFERLWHLNPEKFNPLRNCMESERLDRTWTLLNEFADPKGKTVVDLGCGAGVFSERLTKAGATVHAVDIASNALKLLKEQYPLISKVIQDYLPMTKLTDDSYDLVFALDVLAYLHPDDYRLFFSELARLVKPKGYVICSTPIDINSEDALQRFQALAETEFQIEKWSLGYHRLYIRILNIFDAPIRFIPVEWITKPISRFLKNSPKIMGALEKLSRFIWSDAGISHAIFIGTRRPLIIPSLEDQPEERKHKKQVWE